MVNEDELQVGTILKIEFSNHNVFYKIISITESVREKYKCSYNRNYEKLGKNGYPEDSDFVKSDLGVGFEAGGFQRMESTHEANITIWKNKKEPEPKPEPEEKVSRISKVME